MRIVTTLGECLILLNPNKDNSVIQMGYGVPVWLEILISVSELLMIINCSVNIIIYLHINSTALFTNWSFCMPACIKRCSICRSHRGSDVAFPMPTSSPIPSDTLLHLPRSNDSPNVINMRMDSSYILIIEVPTIERLI